MEKSRSTQISFKEILAGTAVPPVKLDVYWEEKVSSFP